MSNISIISGATLNDVKVKVGDSVMSGVTKIEIHPITRNSGITASITVNIEKLDVLIDDMTITTTRGLNFSQNISR